MDFIFYLNQNNFPFIINYKQVIHTAMEKFIFINTKYDDTKDMKMKTILKYNNWKMLH